MENSDGMVKNEQEVNPSKQSEQLKYQSVQTPQQYYDSDIASVNEKDFLSDNQPPKDIAQERKLLYKQKYLHVYKTIISLGYGLDKPARYDKIKLAYKNLQPQDPKNCITVSQEQAFKILQNQSTHHYNIGCDNQDIERFVTSMRPKQISLFQREQLQTSQKSNIKVLKQRKTYLISVEEWTTVIDIDADRKYLKYILRRGEGPNRVHQFDEVSYRLIIQSQEKRVESKVNLIKMQKELINKTPYITWKILTSMKQNQYSLVQINQELLREIESDEIYHSLLKQLELEEDKSGQRHWKFSIEILEFNKIDDVYLDGRILKKTLAKGVSTAKPDSSSLIYYALTFLHPKDKSVLRKDACFNSDWWEDYSKLQLLGCRKNYLDDYRVSKMLKSVIERMKPAQIAEVQCRDLSLFSFGDDFDEYKTLLKDIGEQLTDRLTFVIRIYNFTQGKTCFNMQLSEKIEQSKRKKVIGVKLLNQSNYAKALKVFQAIVSFYAEGNINQEAYDQKISALMNSILCLMKDQKYSQMIPLCNLVLEKPKHGASIKDIKIHGPKNYKIQNNQNNQGNNEQVIELQNKLELQGDIGVNINKKIIQKCLYRKAMALSQIGQNEQALKAIQKITQITPETSTLKQQVEKRLEQYVSKSKKMFKNMFSS